MSRKTSQQLTLAQRMREAGVERFWVDQVQSLTVGYTVMRATCSLLHKDNTALRAKLGLKPFGKDEEE